MDACCCFHSLTAASAEPHQVQQSSVMLMSPPSPTVSSLHMLRRVGRMKNCARTYWPRINRYSPWLLGIMSASWNSAQCLLQQTSQCLYCNQIIVDYYSVLKLHINYSKLGYLKDRINPLSNRSELKDSGVNHTTRRYGIDTSVFLRRLIQYTFNFKNSGVVLFGQKQVNQGIKIEFCPRLSWSTITTVPAPGLIRPLQIFEHGKVFEVKRSQFKALNFGCRGN